MSEKWTKPLTAVELEHAAGVLPGAIDARSDYDHGADLDAADWAEGFGARLIATVRASDALVARLRRLLGPCRVVTAGRYGNGNEIATCGAERPCPAHDVEVKA